MTTDCAVFLTHKWSPAIAAHFERLRREAAPLVDVYLVANLPPDTPPEAIPADLFIAREDCERVLPARYRDSLEQLWLHRTGHVDLLWVTAFRHDLFARYSRFWLIEFDVDFSGHWGEFFAGLADDPSDLLSAHITPWEEGSTWKWWKSLRRPAEITTPPIRAFMPISRFSRRFIDKIVETYAQPGWHGHFEALLPSLADHHGFAISDIGGKGPFVPKGRENRFYRDVAPDQPPGQRLSHRFRPAHGEAYFGDNPSAFPVPGLIYHPVKRIDPASPPAPKNRTDTKTAKRPRSIQQKLRSLLADPRRLVSAITRRVRSKKPQ